MGKDAGAAEDKEAAVSDTKNEWIFTNLICNFTLPKKYILTLWKGERRKVF